MKRSAHLDKLIAILPAPMIVAMLLPGVITGWNCKRNFPVSHTVSLAAEEIAFAPVNDWTIQQITLEEDSHMISLEHAASSPMDVSYSHLPEGEPERLALLCQREYNGKKESEVIVYAVLRERDGSISINAYPEDSSTYYFAYSYSDQADLA